MNTSIRLVAGLSLGAMAFLAGCRLGPDYSRPPTTMPAAYQELRPSLTTDTAAANEIRW